MNFHVITLMRYKSTPIFWSLHAYMQWIHMLQNMHRWNYSNWWVRGMFNSATVSGYHSTQRWRKARVVQWESHLLSKVH